MVNNHLYKYRSFSFFASQAAIVSNYFVTTTIVGAPPLQSDVVDSLETLFGPKWKALMTNGASYVGSDIQDVTGNPPYAVPAGSVLSGGVGTAGTNPLPTQTCGVITKLTDLVGRQFRGRMYVPFPDQADTTLVVPIVPTAGYVTRLQLLAADFTGQDTIVAAGGGTVTIQWVLVHKAPKVGPTPLPTPVTNERSNKLWGTQRRRGNYGRVNPVPIP